MFRSFEAVIFSLLGSSSLVDIPITASIPLTFIIEKSYLREQHVLSKQGSVICEFLVEAK